MHWLHLTATALHMQKSVLSQISETFTPVPTKFSQRSSAINKQRFVEEKLRCEHSRGLHDIPQRKHHVDRRSVKVSADDMRTGEHEQ